MKKMNELSISTDLFSDLEDTSSTSDPTEYSKRPADVPKLHRVVLLNTTVDDYVLKYYADVHLDTDTLLNDPNFEIFEEIYEDRIFVEKQNINRGDGSRFEHALINRLICEIVKLGENELFRMNDVMIGAKYQYDKYNESDINKSHFLKCMLTSDKIRIDLNIQENAPDIGAFVTIVGWIKIKFLNPDTKVHYIDVQFWNYNYEPEMFFTKYYMERLNRYKIFDNIVPQCIEYDNTLLLDCYSLCNDTLFDVSEDSDEIFHPAELETNAISDTLLNDLANIQFLESFNAPEESNTASKELEDHDSDNDPNMSPNELEISAESDSVTSDTSKESDNEINACFVAI